MPPRITEKAIGLEPHIGIPGKYVVVWKKQKGGSWKAQADIFNTDK